MKFGEKTTPDDRHFMCLSGGNSETGVDSPAGSPDAVVSGSGLSLGPRAAAAGLSAGSSAATLDASPRTNPAVPHVAAQPDLQTRGQSAAALPSASAGDLAAAKILPSGSSVAADPADSSAPPRPTTRLS